MKYENKDNPEYQKSSWLPSDLCTLQWLLQNDPEKKNRIIENLIKLLKEGRKDRRKEVKEGRIEGKKSRKEG